MKYLTFWRSAAKRIRHWLYTPTPSCQKSGRVGKYILYQAKEHSDKEL